MKLISTCTGQLLTILLLLLAVPTFASETVHGSYWYVIDNIQSPSPDAVARVWIALPTERAGQEIRITTLDPQPVEIITDQENGNRIVFWEVHPEPDQHTIFFHYDFTAQLATVHNQVDPADIEAYDTANRLYRRFTQAEFNIEVDSEIRSLARIIIGGEDNPYRQAKLIYDWIVANCEFVPGGYGEPNAKSICRSRQGDCTQYSLLFTALCRAIGIPARTLTCEWLTGGKHVLAEFFLQGYGWVPVDPAIAQLLTPNFKALSSTEVRTFLRSQGIETNDPDWFFGNLYRQRLITTIGNNIQLAGPEPDANLVFTFLTPGGINAQPPACDLSGLGPKVVQGGFFQFGEQSLGNEQVHEIAHQKLANHYFDAGLYAEVEAGCLQILETNPTGVAAWINLGRVYLRKGDYSRAEASFKRALTGQYAVPEEKLEGMIWVHNYLGNCYDLMDRRELAREEYERVVELNVNYKGAVDYARQYLNTPFTEEDF